MVHALESAAAVRPGDKRTTFLSGYVTPIPCLPIPLPSKFLSGILLRHICYAAFVAFMVLLLTVSHGGSIALLASLQKSVASTIPSNKGAGFFEIHSGDLVVGLQQTNDGVQTKYILDSAKRLRLSDAQGTPLFMLILRDPKTKKELKLLSDSGWNRTRVLAAPARGGRTIVWQHPKGDAPKGLRVELRGVPDAPANRLRWQIRVSGAGKTWTIWRLFFPQIALAVHGPETRIFFPRGPGTVKAGLDATPISLVAPYPSAACSMQFLAVYDLKQGTGLYVAAHDPLGSMKWLAIRSEGKRSRIFLAFEHPLPNMGKPGNSFALSGEVVWQLLRGDWFDAARVYRQWVRANARWMPAVKAEGRPDTPLWMRELPVWALSYGAAPGCVPSIKKFAAYMRVPVGFHWYDWHQIPFDNDYPHYFPPKKGFADGVRELQAAGIQVMPYINGQLWDTRDKGIIDFEFSRTAMPGATRDQDGKLYLESYSTKESDGTRVRLAVMCPSSQVWTDRLRKIIRQLFQEYGVKAVYVDQVASAPPRLCFDSTHKHPLGGGSWWAESYRHLLRPVRRDKLRDQILTTESNSEPYIDLFDGYLTWDWQYDGQVPAFPAVYAGAIQMFGRAYRGGATKDLALRMKSGQQLVFGEQIGWLAPQIIYEKNNAEFLRHVVQLRWNLRRYFYAGEMARPPILLKPSPTVTADWQWSGKSLVTTDAVLTGAWRLPAQRKVILLFVNVSDRTVSTAVYFEGKAYGFVGPQVHRTSVTPQGMGKVTLHPASFHQELILPPRTAYAWEFSPP